MTIKDKFMVCSICPGLCRLECPIYMSSRDIRAAPDRLGMAGYLVLEKGEYDLIYNLEFCTGCGYCVDSCPINNELPYAIFRTRALIPEVAEEVGPDTDRVIRLDPDKTYLATNKLLVDIMEEDLSRLSLELIDTSHFYKLVSYGYEVSIEGDGIIVSEDLDVFKPDDKQIISSLEFNWPSRNIGEYILHIPCKLRYMKDKLVELAENIYGPPLKVIVGCTGAGGYLSINYPDITKMTLRRLLKRARTKILTLCIHGWKTMRDVGWEAYTPYILYTEGMKK